MNSKRADLHIHTTASDGTLTPSEAVRQANEVGLAAIGIADHDTLGGLAEAQAAGERFGVQIIPAVEINTDVRDREAHILGYYIDVESRRLRAQLEIHREERLKRGERIVSKLREAGVNVSIERVLEIANGAPVARPHIARAIVESGAVHSLASAFGKFLIPGTPAYVGRYKFSPYEAISLIYACGGVSCLAHPGKDSLEDLLPTLVKEGLRAIEVYHIDHTSEMSRRYAALALRYDLIQTGGSDSHGPNAVKPVRIGDVAVGYEVVEELRESMRHIREGRTQ